jgi:hypothetical protein
MKKRSAELIIIDFFQICMIRFGRKKLATYTNKPLDPMDFNSKKTLNSSSVRPDRIMIYLKKIKNSFGRSFSIFSIRFFCSIRYISVRFDFDLIRIIFKSFTVLMSRCLDTFQVLISL